MQYKNHEIKSAKGAYYVVDGTYRFLTIAAAKKFVDELIAEQE